MSEDSISLGDELKRSITSNSSREKSHTTANKVKEANPHAVSREHMLTDGIIKGEIGFREALNTARETGLLKFRDPKDDKIGDNVLKDELQFFLFNQGNALRMPNTGENEAFYVFEAVLNGPRLPVVIAGVSHVLSQIEVYKGTQHSKDSKRNKTERLSKLLYELTDFQTDLITDELVKETDGDWNETRKEVVEWSNINEKMQVFAEKNTRLSSILERPSVHVGTSDGEPVLATPAKNIYRNSSLAVSN